MYPYAAEESGRVTMSGGPIAFGGGKDLYGSLGTISNKTWTYHVSAPPAATWTWDAYQAVVVGGIAFKGDFSITLSVSKLDGGPITGMFISPTASPADLKFYYMNGGETWNPGWYDENYCLRALNTYNTGEKYRTGLFRYGTLSDNGGTVYKYTRVGTVLSISHSTSTGGPWSGTYSGTCLESDKVLCLYGSAQGYGTGPWTATVVSMSGGLG